MQTVIWENLVNYEIFGPKNAKTILILHGWKRSLKDWSAVAKAMADKQKYRVILVDLPGFGGSSRPKNAFDTKNYADLVIKLIEKLNLSKVTLIGHSFGGRVAVIVAAKDAKISKLVLVDASGITEKSFVNEFKKILSKGMKPFNPIIPRQFKRLFLSEDYLNAGSLLETFKKVVKDKIEKEASQIKIPTLIIWGDKDKEVPISSAKKIKELIPNSRLRIIWNSGHDPFIEKPDKFLEVLNEFI